MFSTLVVLLSLVASQPQVAVLSVQGSPAPHAFRQHMRIQLSGMAQVLEGPALPTRPSGQQVDRARRFLQASKALIAVWTERRATPAGREIVVLAVTRSSRSGDPTEVARVVDDDSPDIERIVALKVGELLYRVLSTAKTEQELTQALAEERETKPKVGRSAPKPQPLPPTFRVRGLLELGTIARWRPQPGLQPGGALGLGGSLQAEAWRGEALAVASLFSTDRTRQENAEVTIRETDGALMLRVLRVWKRWRLGGSLGLTAHWLRASARTDDGRQGSANKLAFSFGAGPEARWLLHPLLELRATVRLQPTAYAQRFAVEDVPISGLTGLGTQGEFSLVFQTP